MNVGILTTPDIRTGGELRETRRYAEEVEAAGFNPVIVNYLETVVGITEAGTLLYSYDDEDRAEPLKQIDVDVVIPNIDGHRGYVNEGVLALRALLANGTPSTHHPATILNANHKMITHILLAQARIPTLYSAMPLTRLPQRPSDLLKVVEEDPRRRVVVKTVEGTEGKGVMIPGGRTEARTVVNGINLQAQPYMVQEYVGPEGSERVNSDVRIVVVNGEAVASMRRSRCEDASDDDEGGLLTGVSSGGKAEPYEPTARETDLALQAAVALGAEVAGVDIMHSRRPHREPLVNEVNVFPGLGIEKTTDTNIAKKVVAFAAQLYYNANPQAAAEAAIALPQTRPAAEQPD